MPVERLDIIDFLKKSKDYPVMDVRSPAEYAHAHIPGAFSLPLFTDEERAIIGTAYKKEGRIVAVNKGLEFFSSGMKTIRSKALEIYSDCGRDEVPVFFIHCWRGGMRSDAVAWLLSLYGYKVFVLTGGYKSYRRWALQQFELKRDFRVLGGYTGSGKTELLGSLKALGECVVDLEQLAHHKGSSFGSLGMPPQPAQEMFENQLAWELGMYCSEEKPVWIEDESPNVGGIHIPVLLWRQMRTAQICFIDIPFDQRLKHITAYYGTFGKNLIADGVLRIKKKLGGLETRNALQYLENDDQERCFEILLKYYDKVYEKALKNHLNEGASLHKIICKSVDTNNARIILESYPE